MEIEITVIDIEFDTVAQKSGKGTYQKATVTYRDLKQGGKVNSKQLFDFSAKDIWNTLKIAEKGDTFLVTMEKNDRGYWDWLAMEKAVEKPQQAAAALRGNTGYDPDNRQLMIVRQSSLKAAIDLLGQGTAVDEVIELSERFIRYVYEGPDTPEVETIRDMDEDALEKVFAKEIE